jgi:acetylornithine deacetylase/succinyl-diaminopimelate desuccinylase-like protein
MRLILHLLPGADFERARRILLPDWIVHGVMLAVDPPAGTGAGSPTDHPAFEALVEVIGEHYRSATVGPYLLPWSATDSRFFRAAGVPSYGFSPFLIFATDTYRRDTRNERIGLPGFLGGIELYRHVLDRLVE